MELTSKSNANEITKKRHELDMDLQAFEASLNDRTMANNATCEALRMDADVEISHLESLQHHGVDVTAYLLASIEQSDKIIKIDEGSAVHNDAGSRVLLQI